MTRQLLQQNHYPDTVINKVAAWKPKVRTPYMQENAALLKIPFRSEEIYRKAKQMVVETGLPINLMSEHTPNLKDLLVHSAFKPSHCSVTYQEGRKQRQEKRRGRPLSACITCLLGLPDRLCDSAGVVYSMERAFCSAEYVGETSRMVRQRYIEHHFQASNKTPGSPWGGHMAEAHRADTIIFKSAKVLAVETRDTQWKIRETIEIQDHRPTVNIYAGWPLAACGVQYAVWCTIM